MRVLVVVAHADDEVLCCGGTIARHVASGDEVHVMTFTDGVGARGIADEAVNQRLREKHAAHDVLGVRHSWVTGLSVEDQRLDAWPLLDLAKSVETVLNGADPAVVYTHWHGDLNQDHRAVASAVLLATRLAAGSKVRQLLACEIPESTSNGFGAHQAFVPNVFVSLSDADIDRKVRAWNHYKSEHREFPHLRSVPQLLCRTSYWGGVAGVSDAEAFVLLREVR